MGDETNERMLEAMRKLDGRLDGLSKDIGGVKGTQDKHTRLLKDNKSRLKDIQASHAEMQKRDVESWVLAFLLAARTPDIHDDAATDEAHENWVAKDTDLAGIWAAFQNSMWHAAWTTQGNRDFHAEPKKSFRVLLTKMKKKKIYELGWKNQGNHDLGGRLSAPRLLLSIATEMKQTRMSDLAWALHEATEKHGAEEKRKKDERAANKKADEEERQREIEVRPSAL